MKIATHKPGLKAEILGILFMLATFNAEGKRSVAMAAWMEFNKDEAT